MEFNMHHHVIEGLVAAERNRERNRVTTVVAVLKVLLLGAVTWSVCAFQLGFWPSLLLVLLAAFV